jgi:predicted ABC-type ATPase
LIAEGYVLSLVYVWLNSPDLCVSRVAARFRSGGHTVEEAVVRRRYIRSLHNFFDLYQPVADDWRVYDNSTGDELRLVAEGHRTQVEVMHDQTVWNLMVGRAGLEHE